MHGPRHLKQIASLLALLLAPVLSWTGCGDDGPATSQYSITEDEAAAIVVNGFGSSASTCGCTAQLEELAGIANGGTLRKETGESPLDTVTIIRSKTGAYSYNCTFHFSYGLVDDHFDVLYDMRGTYDTPRMSSRDTAHASIQFTNLHADTLVVNGYYWRLGGQDSKPAGRMSFNSDLVATLTQISVDKAAKRVIGGTVTFTLRERFPDGFVVSLPGTLTYLEGHQAVLMINFKRYRVNVDTSEVTPG